jgi:hypothetical protein
MRTTVVRLRRTAARVLILLLAVGAWQPAVFAFKIPFHKQITKEQLVAQGFDVDSADAVASADGNTDLFEPATDAAHGDNNMLDAASTRLRTKRTQIGNALNACNRRSALSLLGEALHTTQDIYSHSNSIDNGLAIGDLFGLARGTAACSLPNFAPGGLVSGYFSLFGFSTGNQCRFMPANMCCHLDLNKDAPGERNGTRHTPALNAARGGTVNYLNLVQDDVRARFGEPKATQLLKILKKKQRTVYFAIDDTGSMGGDIAGVQASVSSFLDQVIAGSESPSLGLVTFKDNVSDRGQTCDVEAIRSQVNALFASGGDDCPEASMSALEAALGHFPEAGSNYQLKGGRILLATDASAGDANLGPQVVVDALVKGVSIDSILTGDCASEGFSAAAFSAASANEPEGFSKRAMAVLQTKALDPLTSPSSRVQLAALTDATGGVLFNVARFEVDDVVPTLLELGQPDTAVLLSRKLVLAAGTPRTVRVPIDETLSTRVTFMVTTGTSGSLPSVTLRRPDGTAVAPADSDVRIRNLSSVDTFVVTAPALGRWQLELSGVGSVAVRAFGPTTFQLDSFEFLSPNAIPERPEVDIVPLFGLPVAADHLEADFQYTEVPQTVAASLLQLDGDAIAPLSPITPAEDERSFHTQLTVPNEPFLVETTGLSPGGHEFVRQVALQVDPQTVGITATPTTAVASPATSAAFTLHVQNAGTAEATFALRVVSDQPWTVTTAASVTVPAGATLDLPLSVAVPAGTAEGVSDGLTIFAEDQVALRNRNQVQLTVLSGSSGNRPPDCSGATATPDSVWPPNHGLVAIAIGGLTDPDDDSLSILVTGITSDEAVDAAGSGNTAPDATGAGTSTPNVRAERSGGKDGRVYAIRFQADDGKGGSCSGSVSVSVPHDQGGTAVDSGQLFDATALD